MAKLLYRCSIDGCPHAFSLRMGLEQHEKSYQHDLAAPPQYPCFISACDQRFDSAEALDSHILHGKHITQVESHKFRCAECTKDFRTPYQVHRHLLTRAHRSSTAEFFYHCSARGCGKSVASLEQLHQHTKKYCRLFPCTNPGCARSFYTKYELEIHRDYCGYRIRTATGKLPCSKPGCDKVFKNQGSLRHHLKYSEAHKSETRTRNSLQFRCLINHCHKSFSSTEELERHSKEWNTPCPLAEKLFCYHTFHTEVHARLHAKCHERIWLCEVLGCPLPISRHKMTRNSLDKHTDNYHRGLDELPQAQETTPLLNVREIISEFWIDLLLELLPKSPVPSHNHDPNSGEMDWESANPSNNLEQPSEGEEPSFEDQQVDDIEELGDTLERISPDEIRKRNQQTLRG